MLITLFSVSSFFAFSQNSNLFKAEVPDGYHVGIRMRYANTHQPETKKFFEGQGTIQFVSFYLAASDPKATVSDKDLKCWKDKTPEKSGTYSLSNSGSALIHIGFWGCSLLRDYATELTARKTSKSNYLVADLIADVMNEKGSLLINLNSNHEYKLLVFDLFTQPEAKETFKDILGPLHSNQVYIIWDKTAKPGLPQAISNAKFQPFPLNMKESKPASLFFESSDTWSRANMILVPLNGSGTTQKVTSGRQFPLDKSKYSKMLISKPFGYNVIIKGKPDTLDWKNGTFDYAMAGRGGEDTLRLVPLTYSIIYIDATRSNEMAINQSIDTITNNNPGLYYMYLAWNEHPVIATDAKTLNLLKKKIYDLRFTTANYEFDRKNISRTLSTHIKTVSQRMKVQLHLYLPWENASEQAEKFMKRFSEKDMLDKPKFPCNLYIYGSRSEEIDIGKIPGIKIHILKEN